MNNMRISENEFVFKRCTEKDLSEIVKIQDEAFSLMDNKDILRKNSEEMLLSCLKEPHYTLGAFYNDELAGFVVLYFPEGEEIISNSLIKVDANNKKDANYKLCIVRDEYRGNSLQFLLGKRLDEYAKSKGVEILCATVSPDNPYSMNNILKLGYLYDHSSEKYGGLQRNIYYKLI